MGDLLKDFIKENQLEGGLSKVQAQQAWEAIMGPGVNAYTHSVRLENKKLYVTLGSSVLREELSYGRQKIVGMLNEHLKSEVIDELILR